MENSRPNTLSKNFAMIALRDFRRNVSTAENHYYYPMCKLDTTITINALSKAE